MGPEEA